jgi:serine/threonine-protein kinase
MPIHDALSPDEEELLPLVVAIADGTPVDWPSIDSPLIPQLRHLERLVQGHDAVRSAPRQSDRADETLLTEARRKAAGAADALRVQWGPLIVFEKIGRGSFGDVYRAWDPRLDREVALKLIPEDISAAATSPVIEEGRLLARVRHPNVMTVHGADRCEGRTGIWTEYIRGETLAAEVARRGPLAAGEAARIGLDVCAALGAVHAAGLLHRDVKAQNILRDGGGRIVLGDFGTGIALADDARMSDPRITGTPLYLAPEVIAGGTAMVTSDLYAVGVLLYFLLTGTYPVRGRTLADIRRAHADGARVPLSDACPGLDEPLALVVNKLLADNPAERYQTAEEAAAGLRGPPPQSVAAQPHQNRRLPTIAIAAAAVLTVSLAGAAWWHRSAVAPGRARYSNAPFAVKAGDWIVVSEFVNNTGERVLDATLRTALERELEYSDFARVVQRDRIEDALKLLQRPLDSRINKDLAVELSRRDGGIRAVVTGAITKTDGRYTLTLGVIDPVTGAPVAALNDRAATQADILPAVRRQTLRIREAIGEPAPSIDRSREALRRAVIPSLSALRLFTEARSTINLRGDPDTAFVSTWVTLERIAADIIKEDPQFLGGPMLLGWALSHQGRPQEALARLEHALPLAEGATPQERYWVLAHIHSIKARAPGQPRVIADRQELEKAAAALEALFALQPDHYAVRNNLRNIYGLLGRTKDRAWMNQRIADARPWSVADNFAVAKQLLRDGNVEGAHRYGARAAASLSPGSSTAEPDVSAAVRLFPAYVAWVRDDANEALRLLRQVAGSVANVPEPERRSLYLRLGTMYAAVGRLREGAAAIEAARPANRSDHANTTAVDLERAALYADAGDLPGLRTFAEAWWREPLPDAGPALLGRRVPYLIEAGMLDVADRDLEWFKRRTTNTPKWVPRLQTRQFGPFYASNKGVIALKRGQLAAAVDVLREQLPLLRDGPNWLFGPAGSQTFFAAMQFADALAAKGDLAEAIATLEKTVSDRVALVTSNTPNRWLRASAQLASLYRRNGQGDQARAIEVQLLKVLAHADADHPLAAQLKARR